MLFLSQFLELLCRGDDLIINLKKYMWQDEEYMQQRVAARGRKKTYLLVLRFTVEAGKYVVALESLQL